MLPSGRHIRVGIELDFVAGRREDGAPGGQLGILWETVFKSRKMNAKKAKKFVKLFKRGVRAGRDIGTAFGLASTATGIGTLPGLAISLVSRIGGSIVINFVENGVSI